MAASPDVAVNRTQRRVAEMRARLVDAAETLLVEGGIGALTADEVARRADVSLQTVYNRVGGKQALLLAVAERALEDARAFLTAVYDSDGTARDRISAVGEAYVRLAFERPQSFKIFINPPEDPEAIERIAALANDQHERLSALLRAGVECGELDSRLVPESTATALWGMVNGVLSVALRQDAMRPNSVSPEALIRTTFDIITSGLSPVE